MTYFQEYKNTLNKIISPWERKHEYKADVIPLKRLQLFRVDLLAN